MILSLAVCRVYARSGEGERLGGFDHEPRLFVAVLPRPDLDEAEHSVATRRVVSPASQFGTAVLSLRLPPGVGAA
jgi:hypothetical protein